MVYGMEAYNESLRHGSVYHSSFFIPVDELIALSAIVFLLQTFVGGPLARKLACLFIDPRKAHHGTIVITFSVCTVIMMCPMMSLVATVLFKGIGSTIIAKWLQTVACNFPMAFCWQLVIAGPLVRFLFRKLFESPLSEEE